MRWPTLHECYQRTIRVNVETYRITAAKRSFEYDGSTAAEWIEDEIAWLGERVDRP
jgi:hypothetical protein